MISVENIHFGYKAKCRWFERHVRIEKPVLSGASLTIDAGQIYGLIGPNGSGKTTLTKLVLGIMCQDSGAVTYNGRIRPDLSNPQWKQAVAFVSGASSKLFSSLDLDEHLAMYDAIYTKFDRRSFRAYLNRFKLADKMERKPGSLSFGERIKFEVALTLACNPKVLLLDEPTVGLDPIAISEVRDAVQDYVLRNGACGILTSHNMADISALCASIGFLVNGHIEAFAGKSSDLLEAQYRQVFR